APDIAPTQLVELIEQGEGDDDKAEVVKFASARLESTSAQQLGIKTLLRLLAVEATPWVNQKLAQGFQPKDVDVTAFVETAARSEEAFNALVQFYANARAAIPATHWTTMLDDERFTQNSWQVRTQVDTALTELGKRSAREIGVAWVQKSFEDRNRTDSVAK